MAMNDKKFRVIIVGGGPVGLYMAHALQKADIDFVLLEQQKTVLNFSGRLLFLWPQTVRLFDQIGLLGPIRAAASELHQKKRTYGTDGRVLTTSHFWDFMKENHGYPFLLVIRSDLVRILFTNLRDKDMCIKTNAHVTDIITNNHGVHVKVEDGTTVDGSIVIGADGVHSGTRTLMQRLTKQSAGSNEGNPMLSTFYGVFGCVSSADLPIESEVLFESRGTGTVVQCSRVRGEIQFVTLSPLPRQMADRVKYTTEEMERYAASIADIAVCPNVTFGDIWEHTDKSTAILVNQEEGLLKHWFHGRIALVGDAVHKTTSVNGLGMTCGLHSAAVLANELQSLIAATPSNPSTVLLEEAFARYQQTRETESKMIWSNGYNTIRELTKKSWINWFWDAYVLPWIDMENFAKGILVSLLLIRHGQILSYIPFDEKSGRIAWVRDALATRVD